MAAYAALVSLMNLIDQIHHHPQPPITLDKEQTRFLTENIAFLQDFLETYDSPYSNQEVERLRIRIADAANAAEDVIESHIVDQILARRPAEDVIESPMFDEVLVREPDNDNKGKKRYLQKVNQYFGLVKSYVTKCNSRSQSTSYGEKTSSADRYQSQRKAIMETTSTHDDADKICSAYLYQDLQKVLEDQMDLVKKDVEEFKEKLGAQEHQQRIITSRAFSSKFRSTQHNIMVGLDDVLNELLHKLTGQPHSHRQIIPISGMGGIGKTTLARNVYESQLIIEYFDICSWVVISQQYNMREIVLQLLCGKDQEKRVSLSSMTEEELKEKLYKSLCGRRYMIIMDDLWSNEVWDMIQLLFPDNSNGSRIIITTRLAKLALNLGGSYVIKVDFLDQDKSWSLLCKIVFGEEDCPPELEDVGMKIARNCKGLPLSIVVLGGLLTKSEPTREYWEYIAQNLNSAVNLEDDKRCLKILQTSYDELPVHLKVCFLYMGAFPEDSEIPVFELINMWVAEGFLKPVTGKSLEESGKEYLMDLIDRNLLLVSKREYFEKVVFCNIHDILRDLCIREAQKERFVFFANQNDHEGINTPRRIVIDQNISKTNYLQNLQSASTVRSLICNSVEDLSSGELKLLRVLRRIGEGKYSLENSFQQVNLRHVAFDHNRYPIFSSSSVSLLWNLQTLIMSHCYDVIAPPEIWKMPLLRHVECNNLTLPDPPTGDTEEFVLHNLHTLARILNLKFGEEVVKRIPNVKKLELWYEKASDYCLNNLGHLYKLDRLDCTLQGRRGSLQNLIFPHSLKELHLEQMTFSWEDINTKIGSLPHLLSLEILFVPITTSEWVTIEGQFCSLRFLEIGYVRKWEKWIVKSSHFPCLEYLFLHSLRKLKEIPSEIGEIPTLKSIQLAHCGYSAINSAKQIVDEQEELGNEGLQVTVLLSKSQVLGGKEYEGVESLASHNFQVKIK